MTVSFALQCAASAMTIIGSWSYGNKSTRGPLWGLASQVPWWTLTVHDGLWGLLPVNVAMTFLHMRAFIKWRREEKT